MSQSIINILRQHDNFQKVVPFEPGIDLLIQPDLSAANKELTNEIMNDIELFSEWFDKERRKHNALYAIGGYGEHRTVYANSRVFDETGQHAARRFHLGIDIWGEVMTPVMTPLQARVHSTSFNDRKGDYGATVILEHMLEGTRFYSLFGHLSLAPLEKLFPGKELEPGEAFAAFGSPAENGYWPPHLHFQLIEDMDGRMGDYPGVCPYEEREKWLLNSPDPDLILQMRKYVQ
jgi:murein DD-endopeptidase MepM/ murein hydrolase activator NlpD